MRKILIENAKGIRKLEFNFPDSHGLFLLVGANGAGKTTLLTCMERTCNAFAFSRGFTSSRLWDQVDQYRNTSITYTTDEAYVKFRKKTAKWAPTPKKGSLELLKGFGFSDVVYIRADAQRIDFNQGDLREGNIVAASTEIITTLNSLMETSKFTQLMRLRNANGRGRQATFFYVIKEDGQKYYSEKRFSTGELALLRLVERLNNVDDDTLVLLDEAEMALHPRVQHNLIAYLKDKVAEKNITVFVSTHSPTMIKAVSKDNIIMLSEERDGTIVTTSPCYPATAIGCVDFEEATIFDYIFFVEDDVARAILKQFLNRYMKIVPAHATALASIIPVGGFAQTAQMAVNTRRQVFAQSKIFAVVDQDAFEDMEHKPIFSKLYRENGELIKGFGFTPEVWMVQQIEAQSPALCQKVRGRFHAEISRIVLGNEYRACNSPKPRQIAKDKFLVVKQALAASSGDSEEIVEMALIEIIVQEVADGDIQRLIAPMLRR